MKTRAKIVASALAKMSVTKSGRAGKTKNRGQGDQEQASLYEKIDDHAPEVCGHLHRCSIGLYRSHDTPLKST